MNRKTFKKQKKNGESIKFLIYENSTQISKFFLYYSEIFVNFSQISEYFENGAN